jgi:hypothetical protein
VSSKTQPVANLTTKLHLQFIARRPFTDFVIYSVQIYFPGMPGVHDSTPRNNAPLSANAVNTPGLALANVTWRDTGLLKMCATSWKDVVLIVTPKNTYAITPGGVSGFLGTLSERAVTIGKPPAASS